MVDYGSDQIKTLTFSLTSPATATSGNVPLSFNATQITGRIIGIEIGSPAFAAATGSLTIFSSGATWNNNRIVAQINGIPQDRAFIPIVQYQQSSTNGAVISGLGGGVVNYPVVDGEQIGVATSGTYGGTAVKVNIKYF